MGVIHPLPKGFADMPINEALFAAMKAASFVKPNARKSYRLQRMAEELIARAAPANPKSRVDDATAALRRAAAQDADGGRIGRPHSHAARHDPVLPRRRMGHRRHQPVHPGVRAHGRAAAAPRDLG